MNKTGKHFTPPEAFNVIAKPSGSTCNLNCTYCYYLEKKNLYPSTSDFVMTEDLLEVFTRQYIQEQNAETITFTWQGGEPTLLGLKFFQKAIELQNKYANGKKIANVFQTNGTLLTDDWCNFFSDNNILVGVSIDGPEKLHDFYRPDKSGRPTFREVMRGIELLHKYKVDFNTLSMVNDLTSQYPLEVYQFLKEIGDGFLQFIPIVERRSKREEKLKLVHHVYPHEAEITPWSVKPEDFGKFLTAIFDEWVLNDVGRYYVQLFDVTLANWVGAPAGICIFDETCGTANVIEHNGDVFSCDHFVYEDYKIGNIQNKTFKDMLGSPEQVEFGLNKKDSLPEFCRVCEFVKLCHGECPKHRFISTPDGEAGLNYLCEAYKLFFSHVSPYMKFMANELKNKRPPANVMLWGKEKIDAMNSLNKK
ncbi:MAG: anaerobic sulfatase-maturation protein [Acidobacteriota bacterium]